MNDIRELFLPFLLILLTSGCIPMASHKLEVFPLFLFIIYFFSPSPLRTTFRHKNGLVFSNQTIRSPR